MNEDVFSQKQVNRNFKPVLLISIIFIIWSFIIIDSVKELIIVILLIGFMNVIATINYYDDIIPDKLNLIFGIVGIAINLLIGNLGILSMMGGFFIGGLSLFVIAFIYQLITKREGIGGGLIKYLAALGLWLGYKYILITIILGFMGLSIMWTIILMLNFKKGSHLIPADIYFSSGAFITLLYGDKI